MITSFNNEKNILYSFEKGLQFNILYNPEIWGPHYWFFLNTIALNYPNYPNSITKKKYYELIQNLPLFIPVEQISTEFTFLLNKYPVLPYLDNRKSFVKWIHFIHNKINEKLEKPKISLEIFLINYFNYYNNIFTKNITNNIKQKIIYFSIIIILIIIIYYNYFRKNYE
jgi:hypothetical protein